ncbi:MAG: endonuclease/exonuclease/phosphatase family protein [Pseudomonadota bacterium]
MSLRIATFNVENLVSRFDFSGFRNELHQDRSVKLYDIRSEAEYRQIEQARAIALTDDTRQLTALAIAEAGADIMCLQEVDSLNALKAFEYGYLFKMIGRGYRNKYLVDGNDGRGIDVAVMMRNQTRDGQEIAFIEMQSHAHLTYENLGLFDDAIAETNQPNDRIFRRDCLEISVEVDGMPLSIFLCHFKSMGSPRNGMDGRSATMAVRRAEAMAVRRIIEDRFGGDKAASKRWIIAGDLNDYQERIIITGDRANGFAFEHKAESAGAIDVFTADGFAENAVMRLAPDERWTLFHTRGPDERHLCQLDYLLLSPALAKSNSTRKPDIIRSGQPYRTIFPPHQSVERYPRTGWDRPKASDHCPVAMTLDML